MGSFREYLQKRQYSPKSIERYQLELANYQRWLKKKQIEEKYASYSDVMQYISYLQKEGKEKTTIAKYVNSVKQYYKYLVVEKEIIKNPAEAVELKSVKKRILYEILSPQELEELYKAYPEESSKDRRNKVMLSLLIYQGVSTSELRKLEVKDIQLREGKIYVPGGRKSNERTLDLKAFQLLDLQEYVLQTRPKLLKTYQKETEKLFTTYGSGNRLGNDLEKLLKQLQHINKEVESYKQLRASVITRWIQIHNLREAQYKAGHKYVSSTEKYKLNDLENLREKVSRYHPI